MSSPQWNFANHCPHLCLVAEDVVRWLAQNRHAFQCGEDQEKTCMKTSLNSCITLLHYVGLSHFEIQEVVIVSLM